MKASDFDKKFDSGEEDITQHLDLSKAKRSGLEVTCLRVSTSNKFSSSLSSRQDAGIQVSGKIK